MAGPQKLSKKDLIMLGKKGRLHTISIAFYDREDERGYIFRIPNQTWGMVWFFRSNIFDVGLLLPRGEGEWSIIAPTDIHHCKVTRQDAYFEQQQKFPPDLEPVSTI